MRERLIFTIVFLFFGIIFLLKTVSASTETHLHLGFNYLEGNYTIYYNSWVGISSSIEENESLEVFTEANGTLILDVFGSGTVGGYAFDANLFPLGMGLYNVTSYFLGDENYLPSSITYWVNVTDSYPYLTTCSVLDQAGATYYLTDDIINSSAEICMDIQASNVTLDCQGHMIDGNGEDGLNAVPSASFNTTVENCIITNWISSGIAFEAPTSADNSTAINNFLSDNYIGIDVGGVRNITLMNNIIENNDYGIYIDCYPDIVIYNNLLNNTNNIYIFSGTYCEWNTMKQSGTNIVGGSYLGGNYWTNPNGDGYSNTCADTNTDGICDTPYDVADGTACVLGGDDLPPCGDNTDWLPLSNKYVPASPYATTPSIGPELSSSLDKNLTQGFFSSPILKVIFIYIVALGIAFYSKMPFDGIMLLMILATVISGLFFIGNRVMIILLLIGGGILIGIAILRLTRH